jgi:Nucleotide modification associated domain 2
MQAYFDDPRFAEKKPNLRGTWKDRCGDNFYSQSLDGVWHQHRNRFHLGPDFLAMDTRRPFVFVSHKYWYFGWNAVTIPSEFEPLIGHRGIRVQHAAGLPEKFFDWVEAEFEPSIKGLPNDNPDIEAESLSSDDSIASNVAENEP